MLYSTTGGGDVEDVLCLLRGNPGINVNWTNPDNQWTTLHTASFRDHVEVVKLLFAHLNINVNVKISIGQTPGNEL